MTRARHQAGELGAVLEEAGAEVVEYPVIEIADPLDAAAVENAYRTLSSYHWLVLTSANGASRFFDGLLGAGYDIRVDIFGSKDSVCVGLDTRTPTRSVEAEGPSFPKTHYPDFQNRFAVAYKAELDHFLRLARGQAENPCTAADALEALRIAEAADKSMREGRPVRLEEIPR